MVAEVTGQVLALAGLAVFGLLLNRLLKIELTLACLLTGFLAGQGLSVVDFDTGIRAHNLQDIVFFLVLPVLIFEAAWHLKPALLRRWLPPIMLLATLGVLISCFVTAGIVYFAVGHPTGFPWVAALLTGAILAATDPIAVISQLKSLHAPEDLTTLFEGESLFNDASAVVLFIVVISFAAPQAGGHGAGESGYLAFFATVFLGGLVVGALCGTVSAVVTRLIGNPAASALVLVFTAFGSFYLAEHLFHVSGIMAVMVAALLVRKLLAEVESSVAEGVGYTWSWLGLFFNSVLFVIMGLVITLDMFREQWLAMLIAIGAALTARAAAVAVCGLLSSGFRGKLTAAWQLLLVWGGLRGAVAIALVLSLPLELPYWWTIQSMVFGVVLFGLLVQGTTNKALVKRFGGGAGP